MSSTSVQLLQNEEKPLAKIIKMDSRVKKQNRIQALFKSILAFFGKKNDTFYISK